jgi:DNA repair exonuclease SbcCD ATPase subunit
MPGAVIWAGTLKGPVAPPGKYQVRLRVGKEEMVQTWEWKKDPRLSTTQEEFKEQFELLLKIRDKLTEVNKAINEIRSLKNQIENLSRQIKDRPESKEIIESGARLIEKLKEIEDVLIQSKSRSNQDPLNYPIMLDNKLAALAAVVASADSRPTAASYEVFKELSQKADDEISRLKRLIESDLLFFNKMVQAAGIPAIIVKLK